MLDYSITKSYFSLSFMLFFLLVLFLRRFYSVFEESMQGLVFILIIERNPWDYEATYSGYF